MKNSSVTGSSTYRTLQKHSNPLECGLNIKNLISIVRNFTFAIATVSCIQGSEREKKYEMEQNLRSRHKVTCYHKIFRIQVSKNQPYFC